MGEREREPQDIDTGERMATLARATADAAKHRAVDAHCHLGQSFISGVDIGEEALLATLAARGIDAAMVMPHPHQGPEVAAVHDRIARLAERRPEAIRGMASVSPRA